MKIDQKIVGYEVKKPDAPSGLPTPGTSSKAVPSAVRPKLKSIDFPPGAERMNDKMARPELLIGRTYKLKTPVSEHALYITINDVVLNAGKDYEQRRPFEIFINSKNLDYYQWVVALTRVISAVFRKGGDIGFMVDELKAVFDPKGGYWKPGGHFMPSLIAEIGEVIEKHLIADGLIERPKLDEHQQRLVDQKRAEFEAQSAVPVDVPQP